jgi:hypothetical protein
VATNSEKLDILTEHVIELKEDVASVRGALKVRCPANEARMTRIEARQDRLVTRVVATFAALTAAFGGWLGLGSPGTGG